jgi:hypothetical protein
VSAGIGGSVFIFVASKFSGHSDLANEGWLSCSTLQNATKLQINWPSTTKPPFQNFWVAVEGLFTIGLTISDYFSV